MYVCLCVVCGVFSVWCVCLCVVYVCTSVCTRALIFCVRGKLRKSKQEQLDANGGSWLKVKQETSGL